MSTLQFTPAAMPNPTDKDRAVHRVAEASHRLNEAVRRAVEAGCSVELVRTSRCHDGAGSWGDQIVPTVRTKDSIQDASREDAPKDEDA